MRLKPVDSGEPGVSRMLIFVVAMTLSLAPLSEALGADRTPLKPGRDMFSPEQDIQIGREASRKAEQQLHLLNDERVDDYLNRLGLKLAAYAPGYKYPYQYKCVNDRAINAFALPGGFIYINRGVIEAADSEAQLAGVMAHETSHVALRHGTSQATKASAWQIPLGVLGAAVGGGSIGGLLTQLGGGFTLNSILLKNSRTDESQADVLGTQILYDSGYDPRALGQFFEKIEAESKGHQTAQFFADHPDPGNRMARVDQEVDKLGGPEPGYKTSTDEFLSLKLYVLKLPPPPTNETLQSSQAPAPSNRPEPPSEQTLTYKTEDMELRFPKNWGLNGKGSVFALYPEGGVAKSDKGEASVAYGVIVNLFDASENNGPAPKLDLATDRLIQRLSRVNPNLRVARQRERLRVSGKDALSTYFTNDSPTGGQETDWLVTLRWNDALLYFVCVAPEGEYGGYEKAFKNVIASVHLRH